MLTATQFIWQNFVALSEFKIILPLLKAKLFEWGLSKDPLPVHRLRWFSQGNGLCPSKIKAFQREKNAFSLGKKAFFRRAKALVQSFSCFSILHSWVICFVDNAGTFVHNHSRHPTNQKLAIDNTRQHKRAQTKSGSTLWSSEGPLEQKDSCKLSISEKISSTILKWKSARSQKKRRFKKNIT